MREGWRDGENPSFGRVAGREGEAPAKREGGARAKREAGLEGGREGTRASLKSEPE